MKRTVMVAMVIVVVVAGLGFLAIRRVQQATASASNVQTATVRRGSLVATISTAGVVQAADSVDLTFQTSGQVKAVKVQEGDRVKAGQEIGRASCRERV